MQQIFWMNGKRRENNLKWHKIKNQRHGNYDCWVLYYENKCKFELFPNIDGNYIIDLSSTRFVNQGWLFFVVRNFNFGEILFQIVSDLTKKKGGIQILKNEILKDEDYEITIDKLLTQFMEIGKEEEK